MILCIGECMIELAPVEGNMMRRGFAGDSFNTAWYLRQLGHETGYVSAVGTDAASQEMLNFIEGEGVATDTVQRLEGRGPGLYMISLKDGERSFSYWRDRAAARLMARDIATFKKAIAGAEMLVFSGITMAILESDEDRKSFLSALQEWRSDTGGQIIYDPNMRARLWPDQATMCEWGQRAAEVATMILPSFDEDSLNYGDKTPDDTIARYREWGAELVVVKNGADEMTAWSQAEGRQTMTPARVSVPVDTTAAGDSFNAGFIAALKSGVSLEDAMRAGAEVSAKVIMGRGALVSLANA